MILFLRLKMGDGVATFGDWYENEYVDDFGDSTGKIFCASICQGTFENTDTSEEDLAVVVFYEPRKESLTFRYLNMRTKKQPIWTVMKSHLNTKLIKKQANVHQKVQLQMVIWSLREKIQKLLLMR